MYENVIPIIRNSNILRVEVLDIHLQNRQLEDEASLLLSDVKARCRRLVVNADTALNVYCERDKDYIYRHLKLHAESNITYHSDFGAISRLKVRTPGVFQLKATGVNLFLEHLDVRASNRIQHYRFTFPRLTHAKITTTRLYSKRNY